MLLPTALFRSLLGLCLCLCLLLGHADGTETETIQPRILGGGLGRPKEKNRPPPTLPPHLQEYSEKNRNTLPVIKKNGVPYFDLARVNKTILEIPRVRQPVKGITATSNECTVQSLLLGVSLVMDENLFTYCPLVKITLKGKKWRCLQEGQMLQRPGLIVDVKEALCGDAWYYFNSTIALVHDMQEGIQKFQEFGITSCLIEKCSCKWYFKDDSYSMFIDCEGIGLTDDDLAMLPLLTRNVTGITFNRNNLRSMDALMEYLKPNHEDLKDLLLHNNQMTALPRLGRAFPRISKIFLANNSIEKIDLGDFKDLITRKGLDLTLRGNPFRCDNHMSNVKSIVHQQCKEGWQFCDKILKEVTCRRESDGKQVPLYMVPLPPNSSEVDWWPILNVSLGLMNLIMIYLMVDLIVIHIKACDNNERRPKMDYIVCGLKAVWCMRPWRNARDTKDD